MTNGNNLYYGDNLDIMRRYIKDESEDLVYLDPPFNSAQDYNVLFKEQDGSQDQSLWRYLGMGQGADRAYVEVVVTGEESHKPYKDYACSLVEST